MISTVILLVVAGGVFGALYYYQKTYQRTEISADMHDNLRTAIELITQEVGQAGALPSLAGAAGPPTLAAAVVGSPLAQTVVLLGGVTSSIYPGEQLMVDAGANQETVTVITAGAGSFKAIFGQNHILGTQVNASGVFPTGILTTVNGNTLDLYGDINGDGTLVHIEYTCNPAANGTGTLTMAVTPVTGAGVVSAPSVLVDGLMTNPAGAPCFQVFSVTPGAFPVPFVNQVSVTLSTQTTARDPLTGNFVTMTKSALDIVPRNIQMGLDMANNGVTTRLQNKPYPTMP